ncbi:hypothetical protein [Cellulomonas sp. Root137]|uniref:hypothetical protein n=1 Tax=Cellulomonas sp. Root137 TaxID=1736459 RepID=UPI0006F48DFE|nr:hypothetical protein [Cellulomonas sp. Root137]KQY46238.1 hypothetical protein ASD18_01830 [Cellulomonas sp. Root137]
MRSGPSRTAIRVGHYAEVAEAVHPCEAPYSPRIRLRSTEADDDPTLTTREVDRAAVTRVFRVTTTAVWHDAPVEVQAIRLAGVVVLGQAASRPRGVAVRDTGYTWQQVVDPTELTQVVERETDLLRRRPRWVVDGPVPTQVGTYAEVGGRTLPSGEAFAGLLPVGDAIAGLGEVTAMSTVSTTASLAGARVTVRSVDGSNALVEHTDGRADVVPVGDLTDVAEEIRSLPVPAPPAAPTARVIRAPRLAPGAGVSPELAEWVASGGTRNRELRDLVAALARAADADGAAMIAQETPRILAVDDDLDDARGYLRLDWTLRTATATWAAIGGFADLADALRMLPPVTDDDTALNARPLLEQASPVIDRARIAARRGPADEWEEIAWRAARKGGRADALVEVCKSVPVHGRAVGTSGSAPGAIAALTSLAGAIRYDLGRIVAKRGIDPAVTDASPYPLGAAFRRSAMELLVRALALGAPT